MKGKAVMLGERLNDWAAVSRSPGLEWLCGGAAGC